MFQRQTFQPGTIFGENKVGERLVEQGFSQADSNGNFTSTPSGGQQMVMQPLSIDEQMNSPNYQGLLKRREESRGQDADAQRQLDLLQSNFKKQYIPVPPGQVSQKATYGTPTPDFSRPLVEDKNTRGQESMRIGQVAPPRQFEYDGPGPGMGYQLRTMAQPTQPSQPAQQLGGMFNEPQQRGGMFNQQNQFNPQGMQQMMQFMQQMMQMFSMMGGQNRGGGFGGGFGGQQQYQQPQRYQPQPRQQYQPPPRQQFQPVQQQYGQMGPQQPSPFAQSIRPRY